MDAFNGRSLVHLKKEIGYEPYSGWAFSGLLTNEGGRRGAKRPPLPKICDTYPKMMKLGRGYTLPKEVPKTI